jgi:hypothetical protein
LYQHLLTICSKDLNLGDDADATPGDSEDMDEASSQSSARRPRRGKDADCDPYPKASRWLSMCLKDPKQYLLPSAKTIALKAQILKWIEDAPNDKLISEFP